MYVCIWTDMENIYVTSKHWKNENEHKTKHFVNKKFFLFLVKLSKIAELILYSVFINVKDQEKKKSIMYWIYLWIFIDGDIWRHNGCSENYMHLAFFFSFLLWFVYRNYVNWFDICIYNCIPSNTQYIRVYVQVDCWYCYVLFKIHKISRLNKTRRK